MDAAKGSSKQEFGQPLGNLKRLIKYRLGRDPDDPPRILPPHEFITQKKQTHSLGAPLAVLLLSLNRAQPVGKCSATALPVGKSANSPARGLGVMEGETPTLPLTNQGRFACRNGAKPIRITRGVPNRLPPLMAASLARSSRY